MLLGTTTESVLWIHIHSTDSQMVDASSMRHHQDRYAVLEMYALSTMCAQGMSEYIYTSYHVPVVRGSTP